MSKFADTILEAHRHNDETMTKGFHINPSIYWGFKEF
jgi:hypothetical protein